MFDPTLGRRLEPSTAALCILALLAFLDSVFNYFWPGNGIHGSAGALLVVGSTLLLMIGAVLIWWRRFDGWALSFLHILLGLDFLGTAFAAYLLEAWLLLALVVLGAVAWIFMLTRSGGAHTLRVEA